MSTTTLLATVAASWGVAMAVSPLLQVRAIRARRSSLGVSVGYQAVLLVGFVLWLAYGVASRNFALVVPNAVAAAVSALTIVVTRRYRPAAASSG